MRHFSALLLVHINIYVMTKRGHPGISLALAVLLKANTGEAGSPVVERDVKAAMFVHYVLCYDKRILIRDLNILPGFLFQCVIFKRVTRWIIYTQYDLIAHVFL